MALGGLLSVLRGQDQVFFFDVSDRRDPKFIRSDNPPGSSITDEFAPLQQRRLPRDLHGGGDGAHPGRVVEYNRRTQVRANMAAQTAQRTDSTRTASRSMRSTTSWSPAISSARCGHSMSTTVRPA